MASGAGDVVVVGDLMVDIVVEPPWPIQHGSDTPAGVHVVGGGSGANTACWLATMGRRTRFVAAVGDDASGRGAIADIEAGGVRFAGSVVPGSTTGTCVVLVDPSGERSMLTDRGANDRLSAAVVEAALAERPSWVHVSGYALLEAGSRAAGLAAIAAAREAGVPVSVDASSTAPLRATGPEAFLAWVEGCQVLFANDDELAELGGIGACRRRVEAVVAKHGANGASWHSALVEASVPALSVAVVDTVGAGDALDAGVIDALLRDEAPHDALAAGASVAARSVAAPGARPESTGG